MSDTIPQSISNGCRKYVKSRIIINTFNTFNNVAIQKNKYKAVSKGFAVFDNRLEAIEYIQNYITKSEEYLYQIQQEKKNIVDKISKLQYQLKLKDNLLRKFQI